MSLVIGSRVVDADVATERIVEYVTSNRYLFDDYDAYHTNDDPNLLADGTLLAPVLLNVQVKASSYRKLQRWRPQLERALTALPDRSLRDATDDDIDLVGACFDVLDGERYMGVTLAKVLHRKHPRLIPLYDQNVDACYVPHRVPANKRRTWAEFIRLLATEMRTDLIQGTDAWLAICNAADNARSAPPKLTMLRALDILAWRPDVARTDQTTSPTA